MPLDVACHISALGIADLARGLPGALAALAGAGYRRAVLPPLTIASPSAEHIVTAFAGAAVKPIVTVFQVPTADIASARPSEREAGRRLVRSVLDFAEAVGADHVTGVPYASFGAATGPVPDRVRARVARTVGEYADEAYSRGMTLSFEVLNRYETSMVTTAEGAVAFVEQSGSEHLRIHLDTFHMAIEENDMRRAIRLAGPRLAYLELGQSARGPLAEGVVDVPAVVAASLDAGYSGRFGVEAFSRPMLDPMVADALSIWGAPFREASEILSSSMDCIRRGWRDSIAGRLTDQ